VTGDEVRIAVRFDNFGSTSCTSTPRAKQVKINDELTFGELSSIYPKRPARLLDLVSLKMDFVSSALSHIYNFKNQSDITIEQGDTANKAVKNPGASDK
jgi:hypothetical protein